MNSNCCNPHACYHSQQPAKPPQKKFEDYVLVLSENAGIKSPERILEDVKILTAKICEELGHNWAPSKNQTEDGQVYKISICDRCRSSKSEKVEPLSKLEAIAFAGVGVIVAIVLWKLKRNG